MAHFFKKKTIIWFVEMTKIKKKRPRMAPILKEQALGKILASET